MKLSRLLYYLGSLLLAQLFTLAQATPSAPSPPADAVEVQQEIQQVEAILPKLPDRGAGLFLLAHDYAHLGNLEKALSRLNECMSLEEGFDPVDDPAFAPLKGTPRFQKLIQDILAATRLFI